MCGIAGIFDSRGRASEHEAVVRRMNEIQKHRGPDDEGLFSDAHCVLGHRRLAIIDLSSDGHQPFTSADGRYHLVYNGEIYNYIELREELKQDGWHFRTRTDTEVLLAAYQHWGPSCLEKFNGMFAFAVYDSREQRLFLARDRFGIKPLYYALADGVFYFASEIKAFKAVSTVGRTLNQQSLFDYLVFNRTDIYDETFFREIKRLPKGNCAFFDGRGLLLTQWWNPAVFLTKEPEEDWETVVSNVREILVSAVQLRMRSDVPVGSCLSGGLDSSILLGILFSHPPPSSPLVGEDLHKTLEGYPTFTASFPGLAIDETGYVEALSKRFAFKNYRTFPTAQSAYDNLCDFIYCSDEPTHGPSFYAQYEVMRLAKQNGVKVLLDGQGGDENFAGYDYFRAFFLCGLFRQGRIVRFGRELTGTLCAEGRGMAGRTFIFQTMPRAVKKIVLNRMCPYINEDFFNVHLDSSRIFNEFFDAGSLNDSLLRHFQYKLEHLLRMEDRNSMAFSLEARVPYLDYRLVEYLLGVSDRFKIKDGCLKFLQRKALGEYTVPEVLNRKDKIGFTTPIHDWMSQPFWKKLAADSAANLKKRFGGILQTEKIRTDNNPHLAWKVIELSVWAEIFLK